LRAPVVRLPRPIDEIRHCSETGRPLPGLAYRDAGIFAAESESLFLDGWTGLICGQNVAERGDLLPVRIAGQSFLVVRDGNDEIRVFYNMCRHRGAPLTDRKCSARSGHILCPYHAWSYALDGELETAPHFHRGAPSSPSPAERERLGLLPVRTAFWRDIVFVNPSGTAPPFDEFIRGLDERFAHWTESELRPHSSDEYEIHANWKLAAENFLDVYHLPVVHSQLDGGFAAIQDAEDVELSADILGVSLPGFYGEGSGQAEWLLPRFPGLEEHERPRVEVFAIFPNTLILVESDNQQVIVLRPQTPDLTHETFANYLVSDASQSEELAKEREEIYQMAIEINDQDASLLASLQATRAMDIGAETHLTQAWDVIIQRFQQRWAGLILSSLEE